jgi:hypothetical protein
VQSLWLPTDRQGRVATLQRWFRWLDERGGIAGHPMSCVLLAIAPVVGLGRVVCAAPDVATALGYDVAAALEETDDH